MADIIFATHGKRRTLSIRLDCSFQNREKKQLEKVKVLSILNDCQTQYYFEIGLCLPSEFNKIIVNGEIL